MRLVRVGAVRISGWILTGATAPGALSQSAAKKVGTSDADLPRFSYPVSQPPSTLLLADDATFAPFLAKVDADVRSVLVNYDVQDKETLRELQFERLEEQLLTGDNAGASATLDRLRALQEKPAARAVAGLVDEQYVQAREATGSSSGAAFDAAFQQRFVAALNAIPYAVAQERLKSMRQAYQIFSPTMMASGLKANADAAAAKTNSVDFKTALDLVYYRSMLRVRLPLAPLVMPELTKVIAAHTETKRDIWPARNVMLTATDKATPVNIAIWDSGVDTALYPQQLFVDPHPGGHSSHGLAFDTEGAPYNGTLQPLTADQKAAYPQALSVSQGMDDMQNGIDSPEAGAARKLLSSTPPEQLSTFLQNWDFLGQYMHGTHVAGIAVKDNPAARLVVIEFNDGLTHLPFAPTVAWAEKFKVDFAMVGEYLREHNVRVVNMSWADSQSEFEEWLTKTSSEKDPAVRKELARRIYEVWRDAVEGAIKRAPNTLFVCAAGNSNSDPNFLGDVPASLQLPNLVTVGAVDQAGEETSFTSFGKTVLLHANGYRVPSYVPGGTILKESGTSMASPNVVNLAAKLIALNPSLTPEQTIALMRKGATPSADGRLHVIDPKATVALLRER